ncbi:thymidylate synthase [Chryseobacterium phage MA9V-2]|nr:thymidylate synthase [Chryseobacterium phage MA9V-2]
MGRLNKQPGGLLDSQFSAILSQKTNRTIIEANSVHDAYVLGLHALANGSQDIEVKEGVKTKNLHNAIIELTPQYSEENPMGYFSKRVFCKKRNLTNKIQNAEFAWYMTLNSEVDAITPYIKNWNKFSDDGIHVNSNYGAIWAEQMPGVIQKLVFDKYTRQASLAIYSRDMANMHDSKDINCTLSVDFKILPRAIGGGDELHMTVMMRSNDIVHGLPIDMFCFGTLLELLRNELATYYENLYLGTYTHIATSLHIYENAYDKLEGIELMEPERIQKKNEITAIPPAVTYMNFWVHQPAYIMGILDKKHFAKFTKNYDMFFSFNFINSLVEELYIDKHKNYTNLIKIEDLMPVFDEVVAYCDEYDITLPAQEYAKDKVKMFDLLYDCAKIAGTQMMSTAFLSTVILARDAAHFKQSFTHISGFASSKFPITRYCAYQAVLNYVLNAPKD